MLHNEKKLEDYNISNNDLLLLIEKIGDENNPYFVSRKFLSSISNYELSWG